MTKKFLLLLLVGISIFANAQQVSKHNKHWVFGYQVHFDFGDTYASGVSQSPNLRVQSGTMWGIDNTVIFGAPRSYATVSDENGNFLFCSDGDKLYKKGGCAPDAITCPLVFFKQFSSSVDYSNTIILPKPTSLDKYCVFTNSQDGVYYFQVNATATNVSDDLTFQPTSLLDHLGNPITYETRSRKITSARHSNGKDYWLIVQIRKDSDDLINYADYVYSYLVTCYGVVNQNGESNKPYSIAMLPNRERASGYISNKIKVSHANIENNASIPENIKIALTCSRDKATSGKDIEGVLIGGFNRTNGIVTLGNTVDLLPADPYFNTSSLEFSPDSNLLYVTGDSSIYQVDLSTYAYSALPPISTSSLFNELYVQEDGNTSPSFTGIKDIQLAPNNRIYVSVPGRKDIAEITNPNSYGAAQYLDTSTSLISTTLLPNVPNTSVSGVNKKNGYTQCYFPQLLQKQTGTTNNIVANNDSYNILNRCYQEPVNVLENDLLNGASFSLPLSFYTVSQIGTVSPSSGIGHLTLQSNGVLSFGPAIPAGTYTLSYQICSSSPCGNCSNTATITVVVTDLNEPRSKTAENTNVKVTPNPSNDYFYVDNLNTKQINVFDSYGKLVLKTNVENNSVIIDLSGKPSGIYFMVFESENKKVERKLIKK